MAWQIKVSLRQGIPPAIQILAGKHPAWALRPNWVVEPGPLVADLGEHAGAGEGAEAWEAGDDVGGHCCIERSREGLAVNLAVRRRSASAGALLRWPINRHD